MSALISISSPAGSCRGRVIAGSDTAVAAFLAAHSGSNDALSRFIADSCQQVALIESLVVRPGASGAHDQLLAEFMREAARSGPEAIFVASAAQPARWQEDWDFGGPCGPEGSMLLVHPGWLADVMNTYVPMEPDNEFEEQLTSCQL